MVTSKPSDTNCPYAFYFTFSFCIALLTPILSNIIYCIARGREQLHVKIRVAIARGFTSSHSEQRS